MVYPALFNYFYIVEYLAWFQSVAKCQQILLNLSPKFRLVLYFKFFDHTISGPKIFLCCVVNIVRLFSNVCLNLKFHCGVLKCFLMMHMPALGVNVFPFHPFHRPCALGPEYSVLLKNYSAVFLTSKVCLSGLFKNNSSRDLKQVSLLSFENWRAAKGSQDSRSWAEEPWRCGRGLWEETQQRLLRSPLSSAAGHRERRGPRFHPEALCSFPGASLTVIFQNWSAHFPSAHCTGCLANLQTGKGGKEIKLIWMVTRGTNRLGLTQQGEFSLEERPGGGDFAPTVTPQRCAYKPYPAPQVSMLSTGFLPTHSSQGQAQLPALRSCHVCFPLSECFPVTVSLLDSQQPHSNLFHEWLPELMQPSWYSVLYFRLYKATPELPEWLHPFWFLVELIYLIFLVLLCYSSALRTTKWSKRSYHFLFISTYRWRCFCNRWSFPSLSAKNFRIDFWNLPGHCWGPPYGPLLHFALVSLGNLSFHSEFPDQLQNRGVLSASYVFLGVINGNMAHWKHISMIFT